jgi:protein arginine N-methyltransferase 1
MYSLIEYGNMIADVERFRAYKKAITSVVRPGDAIAEIGCGPGVFALLACQAGARRVYAIDSEPIVDLARQLAAANGFSDRIEFIQSDSRKANLPERVNVIISDIRGAVPLFNHAISTIDDARTRFLAEGGVLIPQRDTLKAAVIEAPSHYEQITSPWRKAAQGLDLSAPLQLVLNHECYHLYFRSEQLLTEPQSWCVLDYQRGAAKNGAAELQFRAARPGTAHGVCVWFEAQLFGSDGYTTGPGTPTSGISGQLFLPWPEPIAVVEGQEFDVILHADLVGNDYVWRWEAKIGVGEGITRHFRQSSLQGANFAPQTLRRRAADFVPALSEEGRANRWLLQAMNGKASLEQMARAAAQQFPKIFPRWEDALRRAADLAAQFSR